MISAMPLSSIYGSSAHYANIGKMENQGIELSVQASLVRTRDFEWIVGGNIAHATSKIKSLGGEEQVILNYDDEVQMVHRVGESPYQYYGYQADGVFATQVEADEANLSNRTGVRYNAGDVRFVDQNGDNRIEIRIVYCWEVPLHPILADFIHSLSTRDLRFRQNSVIQRIIWLIML